MKERRNYHTDHGHNWMISIIQEFEKDLKGISSEKTVSAKSEVKNEIK